MNFVALNQIGFKPSSVKTAFFAGDTVPAFFSIHDSESGKTMFESKKIETKQEHFSNQYISYFDFSDFKTEGTFYIEADGCRSRDFPVMKDVYENLMSEAVKAVSLQKCGEKITEDESLFFSHGMCHHTKARIYGTSSYADVKGGYHDAGDFGRYVVPAAKMIADFIYALKYSSSLDDKVRKQIADIVRYEMQWVLKMQDSKTGGVYHKVTTETFCGFIMPEFDTEELVLSPVSTAATADFAAMCALSSSFFHDADEAFSAELKDKAIKAWNYIEENPDTFFENPPEIKTGQYGDKCVDDERFWAAIELYCLTGDEKYIHRAEEFFDLIKKFEFGWQNVSSYGLVSYLLSDYSDEFFYKRVKIAFLNAADSFIEKMKKNPLSVIYYDDFVFGSNMGILNSGIHLMFAYRFLPDERYLKYASMQFHYCLGQNMLDMSFVSGFGSISPQKQHHRVCIYQGKGIKGFLSGGVDSFLDDDIAKSLLKNKLPYLRYVDHQGSYSTNEISLYWNSALILLLSLL